MTSEDMKSELDKFPFRSLRIHLVSGKTVDVIRPDQGVVLQNSVMIMSDPVLDGYDLVSLRNIERVERLE